MMRLLVFRHLCSRGGDSTIDVFTTMRTSASYAKVREGSGCVREEAFRRGLEGGEVPKRDK
eukprot:2938077-Pleurochrysis_carterae.AAC.1